MPLRKAVEIKASAAETSTGQTAGFETQGGNVNILADVTAASGTSPTLDFTTEWSHNGTDWFSADPADAFTQITAATKQVKTFTTLAPQFRVVFTIAGTTPSFTFSLTRYDT